MYRRVLGIYLSLTITLPLMITNVSASHYMDCENASDVNHYFFNFCEEKCVCEEISPGNYDHVCYREREEFTCMNTARRERFLNAYKAVTTPGHPQYHQMKQLIETHGKLGPGVNHFNDIHTQEFFLPWHRWYAMAVETILRNYDCRITLPWWRWSKKSTTWWIGSPFFPSDNWLGTNSNGACVSNGAFKPPWMPPTISAPTCMTHNFWQSPMPSYSVINGALSTPYTNYAGFTNNIENNVHNGPHCHIGGDMCSRLSPRNPVFFLHHGYIDQLWDRWQKKSANHLTSYNCPSCNINAALPHTVGGTPYTVGENFDLAATRVRYVNYRSRDMETIGHGIKPLPLCMLVRVQKFMFWDIGILEDALTGEAGNGVMKDVIQLRPETPDFYTMKRRLSFWYEDVTDEEQIRWMDAKVTGVVQSKEKFAASISNPVSEEELHKLAGTNEASKMLGFDLGSEQIAELFEKLEICPNWDDVWNSKKRMCKPDKKIKKKNKKELRKGTLLGGEVIYKSYLPQCYDKPYSDCQRQNGVCVSPIDCDKKFEECKSICGSDDSCVCKIQPQCVAEDEHCRSINGKCVPKSLCEPGDDCQVDACAGPGCTCKVDAVRL